MHFLSEKYIAACYVDVDGGSRADMDVSEETKM
jgi:hypothetical protein